MHRFNAILLFLAGGLLAACGNSGNVAVGDAKAVYAAGDPQFEAVSSASGEPAQVDLFDVADALIEVD